jgi:phytoene dehydrogenase-like protein
MRRTAIVVGSGPNGLAAAIVMARNGWDVEVREASSVPGGGVRSAELTRPGFIHDICSAVHPMALCSPFLRGLPLQANGLEWTFSPAELAHPLDDGTAVLLVRSVRETAAELGPDGAAWIKLFDPLVRNWHTLMGETLRPILHIPRHPFLLARFGMRAVLPASWLVRMSFREQRAKALFAGAAAHSVLPLGALLSSAFGFIIGGSAHAVGWPTPSGGSGNLASSPIRILESYGGRVRTDARVNHLRELDGVDAKVLDITPKQLLQLAPDRLPGPYQRTLQRFRYGPGVFKVDWALREPIPWKAKDCSRAITVHLGGTFEEIAASERDCWQGKPPTKPFVLLAQQSLFDPTRAPQGCHTAWAYCHVPNGWTGSALDAIENQVERFAPGFRDCILARTTKSAAEFEAGNNNLVGGDVNGGAPTPLQFVFRPTWRTYRTPLKGTYLCSASTPPGGGVHGMCGANAAQAVLRDFDR